MSGSFSNNIDSRIENVTIYQKLVGKLIYFTLTRPDIAYSVHVLSQFMHAPRQSHLKMAFRVLRYLKGSPGKGVLIEKGKLPSLSAYVDSDWGKWFTSRKSITGFCLFFGGSLVSWKSKKQSTVSRSSAEAEYRALASVTCEIIWVLKLLNDFGVKDVIPVQVFCDNSAAIQIAANPVFHERTKHFEIDLHFVREKVSQGVIKTVKISSLKNTADVFTKGLTCVQHNALCSNLNMFDPFHV